MKTEPCVNAEFFDGRAWLIPFVGHSDERGVLVPFDFKQMPFIPSRTFVVSHVPVGSVRGGHRHQSGMQMLVCLQGCIEILMCYQEAEVSLLLDTSSPGLVFGPGIWCQQKYVTAESMLLVFASEAYDPASYIEDWI
ncbi:MAG: sugar 3,4-ketoisomerase [Gallionellaceae bacterium]